MPEWLHPVLPFVLGILALPFLAEGARRVVCVLAPALALLLVALLPLGTSIEVALLGFDLELLRFDALSRVMAVAFTLFSLLAGIYAFGDRGLMARGSALGLAGGGVGVVCAGDLLSLLFFWELLAISSTFLVWCNGSQQSLAAGMRYALFHILGGLCLLGGVVLHLAGGGELALTALELGAPGTWWMLAGVAVNAAIPPLHAWLPDAYPRATVFGTVFLAAFTTKSAVYVLARLFPGTEPLMWAGAAMALYGVTFAILENDIRRLLSYHIVSQVGFMVAGVGLGTAMALNGSTAHAFCHIFYKGLLMMSAGAVIHATGRGKLTELGNLAAPLKAVLVLMLIGAFSISGVPLLNGFISKSMTISAAAEAHRPAIELMLLVASTGTFLSVGIKLPWFTFFGAHAPPISPVQRAVPRSMMLAMVLTALVCVVTGLVPALVYGLLPHPVDYHPYTLDHVLTAFQLLVAVGLGCWLLRAVLGGKPTLTLDVDRLYRRPLAAGLDSASMACAGSFAAVERGIHALLRALPRAWRAAQAGMVPQGLPQRIAVAMIFCATVWYLAQWH